MEYMKKAFHFHMETKTKRIKSMNIMTRSFFSKNMEPKD